MSFEVGQKAERTLVFTDEMVSAFGALTGDTAPVHFYPDVARQLGYAGPIVHGLLVASIFSELLGRQLPGPDSIIQKIGFDFIAPVYPGKSVHFTAVVSRISEAVGAISIALSAVDDNGDLLSRGTAVCVLRR